MESASLTARDRPHLLREPVRRGMAYLRLWFAALPDTE